MAARAMANFALAELRLVNPRDGWPNPDAGPAAAGADAVLGGARVAQSANEALADCALTFATTVRHRDSSTPVVTPREAAARMREGAARGLRSGILFGPERAGLTADDLAGIQTIVTCPVDPGFGSLNLAQAVLLLAYEWFQAGPVEPPRHAVPAPPATHGEIAALIAHLDGELDAAGFFHVPDRAPATRRTLAALLARPGFTSEEVRTLRGVVRALADLRRRRAQPPSGAIV